MFLSSFSEDLKKHGGGAPIYVDSSDGQITFYVRRIGTNESNKALKDLRRSLFGPFHSAADDDISQLYANWLADYGVTGWDDLVDSDTGEPVLYSKQAARDLFLDESYFQSLNSILINSAASFENFLHDEKEEAIDNVKKQ
jgi:hypothetical protein